MRSRAGDESRIFTTSCNGAKRIRTADPLNAIEVLYQLSYSPTISVLYLPLQEELRQARNEKILKFPTRAIAYPTLQTKCVQ